MRRRIFSMGILLAIVILICVVLYGNGNYVVYMLTYIFSFVFLFCSVILTDSSIVDKIIQALVYALILAAQILYAALVIRLAAEAKQMFDLCRLSGILILFVPFLVRQIWGSRK